MLIAVLNMYCIYWPQARECLMQRITSVDSYYLHFRPCRSLRPHYCGNPAIIFVIYP